MSVLKEAQQLFDRFKAAYLKSDFDGAKALLAELKVKLIQLPALPPVFGPSPTAQQELVLARDALEHAVLLSLKLKDEAVLERSFVQLKTFYADTATLLPPSQQEFPMLGLNLLRLLVQNRIAEFHTELELLQPQVQENPYVKQAIQLEQWLMEGAYNKVLAAAQQLPSEFHSFYMQQLSATVRDEIASCSERAYERLSVDDAQQLMMLPSQKEVLTYAQERGWDVRDGFVWFARDGGAGTAPGGPQALDVIRHSLVYAKELERIV